MNNLDPKFFALLGVNNITKVPSELKKVMEKDNITWRTFADSGGITEKWGSRGTPSYYLIDHAGIIRAKWIGWPGHQAIDDALEKWIAAAKAAGGK